MMMTAANLDSQNLDSQHIASDKPIVDITNLDSIRCALEQVCDPEIPVLSIVDLGILRDLFWCDDELIVVITPTYSGCPAMQTFADDIIALLHHHGINKVKIRTQLAPAWTTDWLSESGKQKLKQYGIAPPTITSTSKHSLLGLDPVVHCPRCNSDKTVQLSRHGSTACKALYQCQDCQEPFDYFKCI